MKFLLSNGSRALRRYKRKQVTEAADDSLQHFSKWIIPAFFKPKVLNAIEIIRDKEKRSDIDIIHDYITKTEASNAGKTLIENLVKEFILLNRKYW